MEHSRPAFTINQKIKCNDIKLLSDKLATIATQHNNHLTCKCIYLNKNKQGAVTYQVSISEFYQEDYIIALNSDWFSLHEEEQPLELIEYFEGLTMLETMHLAFKIPTVEKLHYFTSELTRVYEDEQERTNSQEYAFLKEVYDFFRDKK
jgi:hypothetical protein